MESAEQLRETGKACYFDENAAFETRLEGLRQLQQASRMGDSEATYLLGRLVLENAIRPNHPDPEEHGLRLLCAAANAGFLQARVFLNTYCQTRYRKKRGIDTAPTGPLVDFAGKVIKINRQGVFTPVDGVLTYENGQNILTLRTNVLFLYGGEISNPAAFERAVCTGIRAWEGEYTVFDGQKVTVRVELTRQEKLFDNLVVMPVTSTLTDAIRTAGQIIPNQEKKEQIRSMVKSKRSFATMGMKWTATSRKLIFIQSADGQFADAEEIMHVAKHEFGHALGLGDLYESSADALPGVEAGTYDELDSYRICNKYYNLVMCDHHGPISNNDMEMVILAFRENKMQHYQASRLKGKISAALGRGN